MGNIVNFFPGEIAANNCRVKDYVEFISLINGVLLSSQHRLKYIIKNVDKLLPCDIKTNSEIIPVHDKLGIYLPKLIELKSIKISKSYSDLLVDTLKNLKAILQDHAALKIACSNLETRYPDLLSSFYNQYPYFCLEKTISSLVALNAELYYLEIRQSIAVLNVDYGKYIN